MLPREGLDDSSSLRESELKIFWDTALKLVQDSVGMRQQVITKLAEWGGVQRIQQTMTACDAIEISLSSLVVDLATPFLTIITDRHLKWTHEEQAHATIYSALYVDNGQRCISFTRSIISAIASSSTSFEYLHLLFLVTKLLRSMLARRSALRLRPEMSALQENLDTLLTATVEDLVNEHQLEYRQAVDNLKMLKRIINQEQSKESADESGVVPSHQSYTFKLEHSLVASARPSGPRHDNDFDQIDRIQIMPTVDEIGSNDSDYLPRLDETHHHIRNPLQRLLDRQFRLLREDTLGPIREVLRAVAQKPVKQGTSTALTTTEVRHNRYEVLSIVAMIADRVKGPLLLVRLRQPIMVRRLSDSRQRCEWWQTSLRLSGDTLVCMTNGNGRQVFFSVLDPGYTPFNTDKSRDGDESEIPTFVPKDPKGNPQLNKWYDSKNAFILLAAADTSATAMRGMVSLYSERNSSSLSIVEFRGVLLAAFQPILKALQNMASHCDVPFAHIFAPDDPSAEIEIPPPIYTQAAGFVHDLSSICGGESLHMTADGEVDPDLLSRLSKMDPSQCLGLVHSLSRQFSLIQGCPGCGKSFIAGKLVKVLLANKPQTEIGPIVALSYTNHALDGLLCNLLEMGVDKVIRIGSRSKAPELEQLNLRVVAEQMEKTRSESAADRRAYEARQEAVNLAERYIQSLGAMSRPRALQEYLGKKYPTFEAAIFADVVDEDGFTRKVSPRGVKDPAGSWLKRDGNLAQAARPTRPMAVLEESDPAALTIAEKEVLHRHWTTEAHSRASESLVRALEELTNSQRQLETVRNEKNLRCLEQANVIGVTTSGLAKNLSLLRDLAPQVLLIEEAAEVLESHILASLVPSVQHVIMIGDHEQLRPMINNYELSAARSKHYGLDVSMFERLAVPSEGMRAIPRDTLNVQRRMHPSISDLIRQTVYPALLDFPAVMDYPPIKGVRERLFWLDHGHKEDSQDTVHGRTLSYSNTHEVGVVISLVRHLLRQDCYNGPKEIVVLTPYVRQLQLLRSSLDSEFEIIVSDRDVLDLAGTDAEIAEQKRPVVGRKAKIASALRLATVDNFQGEEGTIIIASLVRSNDRRGCGFLKTSNRINVLLSRARHGLYLIGSRSTFSSQPMWAKVQALLDAKGRIGTQLPLACPRHPEIPILVATAEDFNRLSPDGGCQLICGNRLACGHACKECCHSESRHAAVLCTEDCVRSRRGCEHSCKRLCGEACLDICPETVKDVLLPCGHVAPKLKCWRTQRLEAVRCLVQVQKTSPGCLHEVQLACYVDPTSELYECKGPCNANLPCGHKCKSPCHRCRLIDTQTREVKYEHPGCSTKCPKALTNCSHDCNRACHEGEDCGPCTNKCTARCTHSACGRGCQEPCVPCAEPCQAGCAHTGTCTYPCAVPCDIIPCAIRCENKLSCGHRCPSICGETCPDAKYCQVCCSDEIGEIRVDLLEDHKYREINLDGNPCLFLACGHIYTRQSMDGSMGLGTYFELDAEDQIISAKEAAPFSIAAIKSCIDCRGQLGNINRYARIVRRAELDRATKRFIVWANKRFGKLEAGLHLHEGELVDTRVGSSRELLDEFRGVSVTGPRLLLRQHLSLGANGGGSNPLQDESVAEATRNGATYVINEQSILTVCAPSAALIHRYKDILADLRSIRKFVQETSREEQPFGKIYDLSRQYLKGGNGSSQDLTRVYPPELLQTRQEMLAVSLHLRCITTIVSDLVTYLPKHTDLPEIELDLSESIRQAAELSDEAKLRVQPMLEIEGALHCARLIALSRSHQTSSKPTNEAAQATLTQRVQEAQALLHRATLVCDQHPSTHAASRPEIERVQRMLNGGVFYASISTAEKRAVYLAMSTELHGSGHWYYCVNGHPFTIGECGGAVQVSVCPQCGAAIGGEGHRTVEGVRRAEDWEEELGGLEIGG